MSRLLLLSLVVILIPLGTVRAAILDGFGAKAGVGFVSPDFQFEGSEIIDPGSILRPTFSAFVEWKTSRKSRFNLLHEVRYFGRGYEADRSFVPDSANPSEREVFAHYLGATALLRSNISGPRGGLYLFFGPSLDFLVSADTDPILDRFNDVAVSGHAGLGLQFRLGSTSYWTAELRFNSEFTNAYDSVEGFALESVRHRTLELNAGLRF